MLILLITSIVFLAIGLGGTEALLVAVLGAVGSFIVQAIKKYAGIDGDKAFATTIGVSIVLGLGAVWATGGFSLGIVPAILAVLGASTFVYQWIIKKLPEITFPSNDDTPPTA